jgi:hypothetical protein
MVALDGVTALGDVTDVSLSLLGGCGYLALVTVSFLETSLLFPLLPSEVIVPVAAALLVGDPASLFAFAGVGAVTGRTRRSPAANRPFARGPTRPNIYSTSVI